MTTDKNFDAVFDPFDQIEQQAFLEQSLQKADFEYYIYIQNTPFPFNNTESQFLCASNLPHSSLKNLQDGIVLNKNPLACLNNDSTAHYQTFSWNRHALSNPPELTRLLKDFPQLHGLHFPCQNISGHKKNSLTLLRACHPVSMQEIRQNLFPLRHLVFSARYLIRQNLISHYLNTMHPTLPPRQMEISRCIVADMSNNDIARLLRIKNETVTYHVRQILRNTNSSRRTTGAFKALLPELIT